MKTFLLTFVFVLLIIDTVTPQPVSPVQGDVVINTFDSKWGGAKRAELVVLVNITNTTIDLNGYELQSFGIDGENEKYGYYQFASTDNMPPYSFLLISSYVGLINGVLRDRAWIELPLTDWTDQGYLALRKINPTSPTDYIDVIKHRVTNPVFTGIPLNSGLSTNDPTFIYLDGQVATRGGVSGNINSLVYTGYLNYMNDFVAQDEITTPIQNAGSTPLPVELSSFSAVVLKDKIKLSWETETEVNNYGFEVERKSNVKGQTSEVWEKIGFVNGNGNSNSPKNYSFEDMNVTSGKHSYRLKQIDNDGQFEYSKSVEVDLSVPGKFELSQNYPNPFNPTTTIRFSLPEAGQVKLTVCNLLGEEVTTLVNEFKGAGIHTINFNASKLNSGLYIYKLESNGLTHTRKMTLVK